MEKINWFRRLFLSWTELVNFINASIKQDDKSKEELIQLKTTNKTNEKRIQDLEKHLEDFRVERQNWINDKAELKTAKEEGDKKESLLVKKTSEIENLKDAMAKQKLEMENKWQDMFNKLKPLEKIEKTFFGKTGNKGKGELGEMQLETILEKSGLPLDQFWTKNLTVGTNQVEFAIKSGVENKWIPVDSKVLEGNINEDGKIIVDETYKKSVLTQAKTIKKYLGKTNTVDYGLLVLQNDEIYMSLYDKFPSFFKETIQEHKIYITSPSSFIQFSWSVANILEIYESVRGDQKIYDDMVDTLGGISRFMKKLGAVHKDFDTVVNSHYPALKNKENKLLKKLLKADKIEEIPETIQIN